jgi:hypothetical protein
MIQKYSLLGYVTREAEWWVPGLWPQQLPLLLMACADTPRMLLQNIHSHLPDYIVS